MSEDPDMGHPKSPGAPSIAFFAMEGKVDFHIRVISTRPHDPTQ